MGIFASIGTFFHGGQPAKQQMMNSVYMNTTASGSANVTPGYGKGGRGMMNTNGERPFFGTVTAVSGSTITIQMQGMIRMMRPENDTTTPTVTITPPARTITFTVDSSTTYTGGTLSNITVGTKIAGIGKTTSADAITATKIAINPTIPSGTPPGMFERGMHSNGNPPPGQGYGMPQDAPQQ